MFEITAKELLAPGIVRILVAAPQVAAKAAPGHFVIVQATTDGERIPLTIVSAQDGCIELIFQVMGVSTALLAELEPTMELPTLLGPLGVAPEVQPGEGRVLCVAGGVGAAPILPRARDFHEKGREVLTILGARSKELLLLEDRLKEVSAELHICTDDGSAGHHGFVTDLISEVSQKHDIEEVLAIGPIPMMAAVSNITKQLSLPTTVSLNALMVDGTGMCGACRVTVGGETRFTCVDGPEFDGHQVDFAGLAKRLCQYSDFEQLVYDRYQNERGDCQCLKG